MRIFMILITTLFITSCFQYEEEMVLKKDGSGEVTIRFVFGKFISTMMDLDNEGNANNRPRFKLRNTKGLKILDENAGERNGKRIYEVTIQFDHYSDLRRLDVEADGYDDDIDMDVKDFFEDITFDGKSFERRINLDNHGKKDDEDIPRFVKRMIDVQFSFSLKVEGSSSKDWVFDLDDLTSRNDLVMKLN